MVFGAFGVGPSWVLSWGSLYKHTRITQGKNGAFTIQRLRWFIRWLPDILRTGGRAYFHPLVVTQLPAFAMSSQANQACMFQKLKSLPMAIGHITCSKHIFLSMAAHFGTREACTIDKEKSTHMGFKLRSPGCETDAHTPQPSQHYGQTGSQGFPNYRSQLGGFRQTLDVRGSTSKTLFSGLFSTSELRLEHMTSYYTGTGDVTRSKLGSTSESKPPKYLMQGKLVGWQLSAKKPSKNDFFQPSSETIFFSLRVVYEANVRYFE